MFRKSTIITVIICLGFISLPFFVHAEDTNDSLNQQILNTHDLFESGLTGNTASDPIDVVAIRLIKYALGFIGIVLIVFILWSGFQWMTSGGNTDKVNKAKKRLIAAVIGAIIIFIAYAIADFVFTAVYQAMTEDNTV
ncbi:MAG: hypothetical protein CO073_01715 [Candidatus Komeilibacteria bacterium CG_4_9_14_0_8_um_filter_36_9]|uniref:DUF5671 domain-containing protein n=1 Tax=Candidatus Komeilibacteria bacterium CG_4_9_14_0_8_um_filter_36_9 TaxID=1974473 RepID=A0A2M8DRN2_9BACT|nr:MAG: hypothetical protein CO073_01715 [Candidatus Komeilibacteria bacterium CG_4_9_14_0_8_um_filter_36_9]